MSVVSCAIAFLALMHNRHHGQQAVEGCRCSRGRESLSSTRPPEVPWSTFGIHPVIVPSVGNFNLSPVSTTSTTTTTTIPASSRRPTTSAFATTNVALVHARRRTCVRWRRNGGNASSSASRLQWRCRARYDTFSLRMLFCVPSCRIEAFLKQRSISGYMAADNDNSDHGVHLPLDSASKCSREGEEASATLITTG